MPIWIKKVEHQINLEMHSENFYWLYSFQETGF
jgi:hypothetical protein